VPNQLRIADVSHSATFGRVRFVFDTDTKTDSSGAAVVAADLFGRGLHALARNYFRTRNLTGGIAALCDDDAFLRALRRLADDIYTSVLERTGQPFVIDASPSNGEVVELIRAVYPEATIGSTALSDDAAPSATFHVSVAHVGDEHAESRLVAPIFVVGVPRSGTTWVEHMLRAHPAIGGPASETVIFVALQPLRANVARADGLGQWISQERAVAAMRTFVGGLFAGFLREHAPHATRFLEKTPLHCEHLALINEVFPDAAIVAVQRDGRDVVRSLLEMEFATDDVVVAASRWAELTAAIEQQVVTLPLAREERYERLLDNPLDRVEQLMTWLRLDVDDEVRAEIARRASERVAQFNTTGEVGSGKWRLLSEREQRAVYRHAGERLVAMGYVDDRALRDARRGAAYRAEEVVRGLRRRLRV
jgi:hypothetical protein